MIGDFLMKIIARIHTDFPSKFGVPRQSGLINSLEATIVFEPEFRNPTALKGLEDFSHIWLIWEFSKAVRDTWSPTVRPPRLGGNKRIGVFATRSPFRPNPIGISCVELKGIDLHTAEGPVLHVLGADMVNNTPIYDIKPYLPAVDSYPNATGGFTDLIEEKPLEVDFSEQWLQFIPRNLQGALLSVLAQDPRPSYQDDPERLYGFEFGGFEIKFVVQDNRLYVREVQVLN
jgi:tRNA-Thr(GGU) m(6)t(6)A37 methyltransferase TsaA